MPTRGSANHGVPRSYQAAENISWRENQAAIGNAYGSVTAP